MTLNRNLDNIDAQGRKSTNTEVADLQEKNIQMLPDGPNKAQLETAIYNADDIQKQELIKDYLAKGKNYRLRADFFAPKGLGKSSPAEDFFKDPNLGQVSKLDAKLKKNEARLTKWEKVTGEKFNGETTNQFVQMVGQYYEGKIMGDTPPPGQDPFSKIDKNANFRWTEGETNKNLQWKKMLVDGNVNPTEFFDWLDTNMRPTVEQRDQDIQKWAEEGLKKAEKNPQLFSPKYVEYLKNAADNIKKTGKNPFPVELWQNFEKLIVKEQEQKRLKLESDISKDFDANIKLIGVQNVMKWKKGWLKEASIQELNDWFKGDNPAAKTEYQQEIERLQQQEQDFLTALDSYPAEANKQEYKDWFYSLNGDEREQCFEYLKKQQGKLEGTQKDAATLLGKSKEFLSEKEVTQLHLPNLSELSNTEQADKVEEIERNAEKRQHLVAKFKSRNKNFEQEIEDFQKGASLKELPEILKPIQDIANEMQDEECTSITDALQTCDGIKAEYEDPENVEMDVQEADLLQMFLEDHNISNILLAETFSQKAEKDRGKKESIAENLDDAQTGEQQEEYVQAVKEHEQEKNPEAANDNRDWETEVALNGEYMKNALHEDTSFQEKFQEVQERNADKILQGNDQLADSVKSTKDKISLKIEEGETTQKMTKATSKQVFEAMKTDPTRVELTDSSGQKLEDKGKKKQKLTKKLGEGIKKFFGEKEAKKVSTQGLTKSLQSLRSTVNESDTEDAARAKLAKEFHKNFKGMKKTAANDNRAKGKKKAA